jgi:hypothetical protein
MNNKRKHRLERVERVERTGLSRHRTGQDRTCWSSECNKIDVMRIVSLPLTVSVESVRCAPDRGLN